MEEITHRALYKQFYVRLIFPCLQETDRITLSASLLTAHISFDVI